MNESTVISYRLMIYMARPDESSLRMKTRPDEFSLRVKTRPDEFSLRVKTRPDEVSLRMKSKIETELFFLLPVCSKASALVGRLEMPRDGKVYGLTHIGLISLFPLKLALDCPKTAQTNLKTAKSGLASQSALKRLKM